MVAQPLSWRASWNEFIHGGYGADYFQKKALVLGAKITLGLKVSNERTEEVLEHTFEVFDTAVRTMTVFGTQHSAIEFYTAARNWVNGGDEAQAGARTWKFIHKGVYLVKESGYFINLLSLLTIIPTIKNVGFLIHGAGIIRDLMSSYKNVEYLRSNPNDDQGICTQKEWVALASNVFSIAVSVLTIHNLLLGAGVMLSVRGVRFLAQKDVSKVGIDALYMTSHTLAFFNKVYSVRWNVA